MLLQAVLQLEALLGTPRAFAELYGTLTGTTTPTTLWTDADLSVAHDSPVVADDEGIFPPIYVSGVILTRIRIIEAGGDLNTPLIDVDPVNEVTVINEDNLADGAIEAKLGYTPLNPDGSIDLTGPLKYDFSPDPTAWNEDTLGYMGSPTETHNGNYTLLITDAGKTLVKNNTTAYNWTLPLNADVAFPVGYGVWMVNLGASGNVTVVPSGGVTLTLAGATSSGNRTLVAGAMVFVKQVATDVWKTTGAGAS